MVVAVNIHKGVNGGIHRLVFCRAQAADATGITIGFLRGTPKVNKPREVPMSGSRRGMLQQRNGPYSE